MTALLKNTLKIAFLSTLLVPQAHTFKLSLKKPATTVGSADHLFETKFSAVEEPAAVAELQALVAQARTQGRKIALVGAGKSMGGQTASGAASDYRVSLQKLNKVINLNVRDKEVTVQAGMTWRMLQEVLAPYRLAIKAMQSYHDFAIGGSLSVNVHGQDILYNPIITTVRSLRLLQADGTIINVSRTENSELLGLVIGGYGLFGIIVDVTLSVTDDVLLQRNVAIIESHELADYFEKHIKNNPNMQLYSARFSIGSQHLLEQAFVISYEVVEQDTPELFVLEQFPQNKLQKTLLAVAGKNGLMKKFRFTLEKIYLDKKQIISRNNFNNNTIASLPADTASARYILQEYFIPYDKLTQFIDDLRALIKAKNINMLNVTARHVCADTESKLAFARQDCCAFVLYISIPPTAQGYEETQQWSKELIDKALACGGTYYLPYQLLGTQSQFEAAYPNWKEFVAHKKQYDPAELFTNKLYQTYK